MRSRGEFPEACDRTPKYIRFRLVNLDIPVPGYDPEDMDNALETKLEESDVRSYLTEDEWQSYQNDDEELIDLLNDDDIEQELGEKQP